MIEKLRPDVLTLSPIFYDLSVSLNLFSKAEMRQFGANGKQPISYGPYETTNNMKSLLKGQTRRRGYDDALVVVGRVNIDRHFFALLFARLCEIYNRLQSNYCILWRVPAAKSSFMGWKLIK